MISLQLYVFILLTISAVGMYFISGVLVKQVRLIRAPFELNDQYDEDVKKILRRFRKILFALSLTIVIMGMIPVAINLITLFHDTGRPRVISATSLVYSLGVHLQSLLLSYLVSRLYRLANNEKDITDYTQHQLERELQDAKHDK